MVPRDEAREAAEVGAARQEVEAAAAAASAALAAELQVARRGRADAEAREAQLQAQVRARCPRPGRVRQKLQHVLVRTYRVLTLSGRCARLGRRLGILLMSIRDRGLFKAPVVEG